MLCSLHIMFRTNQNCQIYYVILKKTLNHALNIPIVNTCYCIHVTHTNLCLILSAYSSQLMFDPYNIWDPIYQCCSMTIAHILLFILTKPTCIQIQLYIHIDCPTIHQIIIVGFTFSLLIRWYVLIHIIT